MYLPKPWLISLYFVDSALTNTEQAAKSKPGVTYSNPYFKGTKEERDAQVKRISALFGVECNFCHNEGFDGIYGRRGKIEGDDDGLRRPGG